MNVYNFDPTNGQLLGVDAATADPMEPGRYLVPAWATLDVPPAAAPDQVACYVIPGTDVAPATHHGQQGAWELRQLVA